MAVARLEDMMIWGQGGYCSCDLYTAFEGSNFGVDCMTALLLDAPLNSSFPYLELYLYNMTTQLYNFIIWGLAASPHVLARSSRCWKSDPIVSIENIRRHLQ